MLIVALAVGGGAMAATDTSVEEVVALVEAKLEELMGGNPEEVVDAMDDEEAGDPFAVIRAQAGVLPERITQFERRSERNADGCIRRYEDDY